MKPLVTAIVILFFTAACSVQESKYDTTKPWTYWWWMGSAVDRENISLQLNQFAESGLGGVHIIPIYGVREYEDQFIDFLSDEWLEMVDFTINEANNHGLGVDMTLGTGWPYGGPWIQEDFAAKKLVIDENGLPSTGFTGQKVKRAAPGGEGLVMDYFNPDAVVFYLDHFDSVFKTSGYQITPRAFYHDSYEVYGANWTNDFLDKFKELQGYDLKEVFSILMDDSHPDNDAVVHDYRETVSELLYSVFTEKWSGWCTDKGSLSRNQAHGSPGNILDLYGLSDIPETESFGCSNFSIPGLTCDPDYEESRFGRPNPLMMKFASSPAHLMGKKLVSSETATWLGNHFKVSLKDIKPQIDELFIAGINHVFYHGTTYSPAAEEWPGWLFYASTNFGPSSHFYDELPLLNSYITECQKVLQESEPDNDVLLYFPIHDLWSKYPGIQPVMLDVHKYHQWFNTTGVGETAREMWENGLCFDYISDKQLEDLRVGKDGTMYHNGASDYYVIVIPSIDFISSETLTHLQILAEQGARIVFIDQLPSRFAGYFPNHYPWLVFDRIIGNFDDIIQIQDLTNYLRKRGIRQEDIKQKGLDFIRKKNSEGTVYFISNLRDIFYSDEISLKSAYHYIRIKDALNNKSGYVKTDKEFRLNLQPGQSVFIQTSMDKPESEEWKYFAPVDSLDLNNNWKVEFLSGDKENIKDKYSVDSLTSWTDWGQELWHFCGKAKYSNTFTLSEIKNENHYTIEFSDIRETAEIIINGKNCGTIWALPYELEIPSDFLQKENTIDIIVQNLSANRIKLVDSLNPGWKKFYDINFVDIQYMPFNTIEWDFEPSGLIGVISLIRCK